ncbi:hypothetical protein P170DRAFT_431486 [Aspergillus steynii IBT 23096]|uniref:Uncharacterized protein n=1 Tax=Aspergillus steynii IBT 23096 TaxID=1392250 RepID=A0A2I2GLB6_9EURO|nr:uncharacterized protein P170DRAFT_431486 [Aspergillus steynii IBT 23096]PLB53657.1 hypothetical protein P170DRAFT_431486 [Aspergillus steynii IBT 23096]
MREILATLTARRRRPQVHWTITTLPLLIYDLYLTGLPLGAWGVIGSLILFAILPAP